MTGEGDGANSTASGGGGHHSLFQVGENVEFQLVVIHLSILVACVRAFELLLHWLEQMLHSRPKYHEMLTKTYRELMILGLIAFGIKLFKENPGVNPYSNALMAFQVADMTIFLMALMLIVQAIGIFAVLRSKNLELDRDDLVTSQEALERVDALRERLQSANWVTRLFKRKSLDPLIQWRLARYYFLQTHGLPQLFPFSKYIRHAQDNQITHMIDVNMSTWVVLLTGVWLLNLTVQVIRTNSHDPTSAKVHQLAIVIGFWIFTWILLVIHVLVLLYLQCFLKKLAAIAGFEKREDYQKCLEHVAQHENRILAEETTGKALDRMREFQEELERDHQELHGQLSHLVEEDTGLQLVKEMTDNFSRSSRSSLALTSRSSAGSSNEHEGIELQQCVDSMRATVGQDDAQPEDELQSGELDEGAMTKSQRVRFHAHPKEEEDVSGQNLSTQQQPTPRFHRTFWHFVLKLLLMFNGIYAALFLQCVWYQLGELFRERHWITMLTLPLPMLLNKLVFQPFILRYFVLAASLSKVDLMTFSEVVDEFEEVLKMRFEVTDTINHKMRASQKTLEDLHQAFVARDPKATGEVDIHDLHRVLQAFGYHISIFRFNLVVRFVFEVHHHKVSYQQVEDMVRLGCGPSSHAPGALMSQATQEDEFTVTVTKDRNDNTIRRNNDGYDRLDTALRRMPSKMLITGRSRRDTKEQSGPGKKSSV